MFCRNCGNEIDENAAVCVKCGFEKGTGNKFCQNCGKEIEPGAAFCVNCGHVIENKVRIDPSLQKSKLTAGLLGLFLGGLGVHNFYLGYNGKGIAQIALSFLSCGAIGWAWGIIEGILIFCGKIDTDANGIPLSE